MPQATTLPAIHEAIAATLKTAFPELKDITAYERLAQTAAVPRVMFEQIDALPIDGHGDIGTGQYAAAIQFSAYVLGEPRSGPAAELAIRELALRISAFLNRAHLGIPAHVSEVKGCYLDYIRAGGRNAEGRNGAAFVKVQRIDFTVSALINPSVWDWPSGPVEIIIEDGEPAA